MTVYKRRGSKFYHFDFVYQGQRYKRTTKMSNQREAEKVANLFFMKLVQGELVGNTLRKIPTLRGFRDEFVAAVKADKSGKPKTVVFYEYC